VESVEEPQPSEEEPSSAAIAFFEKSSKLELTLCAEQDWNGAAISQNTTAVATLAIMIDVDNLFIFSSPLLDSFVEWYAEFGNTSAWRSFTAGVFRSPQ